MNILVDMNLSPDWISKFKNEGFQAVHWSSVGSPDAPDSEILIWALENDYVVFTHDLDFGAILAATQAASPSVIQVRTKDTLPEVLGETVLNLVREYSEVILQGALITFDLTKTRVRILPVR
jgi:predicted nuclease of predicted toxin-antitoxin system